MKFKRLSGILLHPTSLPGPYGIGDLGPQAYHWVDFLEKSGTGLWQVLPLGPTGYGDSPYQCFSAFAGNPYLISPEMLMRENLLQPDDLADRPRFPIGRVDFGAIFFWKPSVLNRAHQRFQGLKNSPLHAEFQAFRQANAEWIEDYALFMALKDAHGGSPWPTWEAPLRDRHPAALAEAAAQHVESVERQIFRQFLFFSQWDALREYAHKKGIQVIGDIPIFVAHDSADVWANPGLFHLDEEGHTIVQAGVPPDYFSPTGQLWGNPLYRWDIHKQTGYTWWIKRIKAVLSLVDIIRLDHFRGFAGYWEVPGKATTAIDGQWVTGPGADLFDAIRADLGDLPIIAEDLGDITPDVVELRDQFDLPGMKIIQFAFGSDPDAPFLPHNYTANCVVYTGTHDNDTARGWYESAKEDEKDFFHRYLGRDGKDPAADMIRSAWSSVAMLALAPMQDFLNMGNEARMNYPGNPSGNWSWRMPDQSASPELMERVKGMNELYSRLKDKPIKKKFAHGG